MRKLVCDPKAEISGQTVSAYLDNIQSYDSQRIFEENGITDVDVTKWYPLQPLLNVLYELSIQPNAMQNIVAIGLQIANYGIDPEETTNVPLDAVLEHWNEHMYANIRGADIGVISAEKVEDKFYRVTHKTVWPDYLLYGLAYGFARRCLPKDTSFKIWFEELDNRLDSGGAEKTAFCVQWK